MGGKGVKRHFKKYRPCSLLFEVKHLGLLLNETKALQVSISFCNGLAVHLRPFTSKLHCHYIWTAKLKQKSYNTWTLIRL